MTSRISAGSASTTGRLVTVLAVLTAAALPSGALAARQPTPHFYTRGVSHVSGTSAELEGAVNTEGFPTRYFFEYGPTVAYGLKSKEAAVPIPNPLKPVNVGQTVSGLLVGYHYRIVGFYTNHQGVVVGPLRGTDKSFSGGKAGKLKFVIAKGREERISTVYGSVLSLTGSLTGHNNAGKPLSLQATPFPFTAPFTTLGGTVVSSRAGSFSFTVARVSQDTRFRFVALDPRPVYSPPLEVHVTPRITLHLRSAGHTGLYRVYGTVAPARTGARVVLQRLAPQRAGSTRSGPRGVPVAGTVLKRASSSLSRYSVIVKLSGTSHYRVLVQLPKGALDSGYSSNILVRAPKTTTKKR